MNALMMCVHCNKSVSNCTCICVCGHFGHDHGAVSGICAAVDCPCVHYTKRKGIEVVGATEVDLVNHPPHYNSHPSGVECIDVVEHMPYNRGNAIKYLWRAGMKPGEDELVTLRKARWCVDREIGRVERIRKAGP